MRLDEAAATGQRGPRDAGGAGPRAPRDAPPGRPARGGAARRDEKRDDGAMAEALKRALQGR
jgi:hypothetical protein